MLFRVRGTHKGNFFGIAPTDKPFDIHELGIFRLADGRITEAWFMADELGLLQQLGAKMPARKDGQRIVPPVTGEGDDPDQLVATWSAMSYLPPGPDSMTLRENRIMVVRQKGSGPAAADRASDFRQTRSAYICATTATPRASAATITAALPDRRTASTTCCGRRKVWMRFRVAGAWRQAVRLCADGRRVEVPEVGIMRITDRKWKEAWYCRRARAALCSRAVDAVLDNALAPHL
jgi:hypothetical protein